jgi:phage tail-like protein
MAIKFARAQMQGTTGNVGGDFQLQTAFNVEIEGSLVGGIHLVEGLNSVNDTVTYKDNDDRFLRYRPGNQQAIRFTLTRDLALTPEFLDWFMTVVNGKVLRKAVTITKMTDDHTGKSGINLFECWPVSYSISGFDSKNNAHLVEVIEVMAERVQYA